MSLPRVLVVDDDPQIAKMLVRYLSGEGFEVAVAASGAAMRTAVADARPDLVLLDLKLPDADGLELARELRGLPGRVGIIIVTGKDEPVDRIVGLELGADDYVVKPFHLREVLARIKSVLRRMEPQPIVAVVPAAQEDAREKFGFEGWCVDLTGRTLTAPDGSDVELTAAEFDLLRAFIERPNRVLSRDQLMDILTGRELDVFDRTIDTRVKRLRQKLEAGGGGAGLVRTVRSAGYVFAAPVKPV